MELRDICFERKQIASKESTESKETGAQTSSRGEVREMSLYQSLLQGLIL
jgi:hypothetical protein